MGPTYFLLLSLFVLLGSACWCAADASQANDFSCNCDHCDERKVTSIEANETDNDAAADVDATNVEDADGDGNRTICARDRDQEDRSFPSVCRMLCYNSCTRYRIWIYVENNEKKYTANAFRTSGLRTARCSSTCQSHNRVSFFIGRIHMVLKDLKKCGQY